MRLKYKLRTAWEELKLRVRMLVRGLSFAFVPRNALFPVGRLYAVHYRNGVATDLGLVSTKVVTDAGVQAVVDGFQGLFTISNFKYHGSGTGGTAESAAQTTLVTEVASRATGTQTEGASANIYKTVGTVSYSSTLAITEHGLFSASSAGTMLDRSLFSAINVISGDSIAFTYELTLPSGG